MGKGRCELSANPYGVVVTGHPTYDELKRALTATAHFEVGPIGGLVDIHHPGIWLESDDDAPGLHAGGWIIDIFPGSQQELTRPVAHEVVDLLTAAGIDSYAFHEDPTVLDPRP